MGKATQKNLYLSLMKIAVGYKSNYRKAELQNS